MGIFSKLFKKKDDIKDNVVKITVHVVYNSGHESTFVTNLVTRESAAAMERYYRYLFMNGEKVQLGGDNPVILNMYKIASVSATAELVE